MARLPLTLLGLTALLTGCGDDYGGGYADGYGDGTGGMEDPVVDELQADEPEACDEDSEVHLYLSPDDSNSMSAPVQVREMIMAGSWIPAHLAARHWEFLNYYSFEYPEAEPGQVSLRAEMRVLGDDRFELQIGVGSERLSNAERTPMNITLVLDESGSMSGEAIARLRDVARTIAGSLREGDVISMVTWSTENNTRLASHAVAGPDDPTLLAEIAAIDAGGGTDLHSGLTRGYELAQANFSADRINRVVLISDGGANVGITDADFIAAQAGGESEDGIYLVGVGVGDPNGYNDELMDTVTDVGKGASIFIPSEAEARKVFGEDFVNTMGVAARDVRVELQLPPGFEIVRFSGEEYSSDPSEIEPQHLAPNDAMVFFQELETCAPDLIGADTQLAVTVRWKDPIDFAAHELTVERSFDELLSQTSPMLEKGAAILSYAEAVAAGGEADSLATAEADLLAAEAALPDDPDLAEIRAVLQAM